MTFSSATSPDPGILIQQGIEGQIGMLTCQMIEMRVRLQLAYQEIAQLQARLKQQADDRFEAEMDEDVLREEAKFENEA